MIHVDTFVAEMERRWIAYPPGLRPRLVTPAVRALWAKLCGIFNAQLTPDALLAPRPVIAAPLGAGKTTAMMVWASMLPRDSHPGLLIVVRTVAAADAVARTINAWGGAAYAFHSKLPNAILQQHLACDLRDLAHHPTLVICHRGYEVSVDQFALGDTERKFDATHAWGDGRRRIVMVDEAMDLVYQADLRLRDLEEALGYVKDHRLAWKILTAFVDMTLDAPPHKRSVIDAARVLQVLDVNRDAADAALLGVWPAVKSKIKDRRTRARVGDVLARVRRHLALHRWSDGDHTIVGGRVLLPPEAGFVVLDATGAGNAVYTSSPFYTVIEDNAVRRYDAVEAHVVRATGTGIKVMRDDVEEDGAQITRPTLGLVLEKFGKDHGVLVVTNQESEAFVRQVWSAAGFRKLYVEHWQNLDGRNDFIDCDVFVALTVPWARTSHDAAVYQAISGCELTTEELNDEPTEVRDLRGVRVAGQLAQGAGRLGALRDLTRADGQAEPAVLVLRLPLGPKNLVTDHVLARLQRVLPGLQVHEMGEQRYRDQVAIWGELFTRVGPLARPDYVSPRNWVRLLNNKALREHAAKKGLELKKVGGRMVVQPTGAVMLPTSEAVIVDFAKTVVDESPLASCGLSEDARRRAVKRPTVQTALAALGLRVEDRPSGIVLTRRPPEPTPAERVVRAKQADPSATVRQVAEAAGVSFSYAAKVVRRLCP